MPNLYVRTRYNPGDRIPVMHIQLLLELSLIFALIILQFVFNQSQNSLFNTAYSQRNATVTLDSSGIPIVDYGYVGGGSLGGGYIGGVHIGPQRNPVSVANHALSDYAAYNATYQAIHLQKFLNNANWLVGNALPKGNYSILEYQFPWPTYDLKKPWYSGMAQGRAIEVLVKAHQVTGDKKYLDTARSLLNALFVEVKDGGVTYKTPNDGWWYEEYARPGAIESRVLNGHIFTLLGIYEYYFYTKHHDAKFLFDQGVTALRNNLPKYEYSKGQYSTYDILSKDKPAPLNYHRYHVEDLGKLYEITGEEIFKLYHDKWLDFSLPEDVLKQLESRTVEAK